MTDSEPLRDLLPDYRRHLRARNVAPATETAYLTSATHLVDFLEVTGLGATTADLDGAHGGHRLIEAWLEYVLATPNRRTGNPISAGQAAKHYRQGQAFCKWLTETEELLSTSPYAKTSPPAVPEHPVPVLTIEQLRALVATTAGKTFTQRRDNALIRLFVDTGCRSDEISSLELESVDFDSDTIYVVGKGRRPRVVPFGPSVGEALRRYVRARKGHPYAGRSDALWLGRQGPLGTDGIRHMLDRRADDAGVPHIHPHMFRHTMAHRWLVAGGQETDLMRVMGWRSREMVGLYAASAGVERAQAAHRRLDLSADL